MHRLATLARQSALLIALVCIYLAFNQKLTLYVHPRFVWFSVIMAAIYIFCTFKRTATHEYKSTGRKAVVLFSYFGQIIFCAALLTTKPSSLSSSTAAQRSINTSSPTSTLSDPLTTLNRFGGDLSQLSIKEWSSLLSQITEPEYYVGKKFKGTGFITKDQTGNTNILYISRFVLTCCAVDVQPIGVPVYLENWQNTYAVDQWVDVVGEFITTPNNTPAVRASTIERTEEPEQPYVY